MSNTLKPIVGVGTKLPQGTVVSISNDGVVVEKKGKKSNEYVGRSDYFYPVTVQSQDEIIGTIRNVKVELCLKNSVKGSLLD